jgi:hypothetical protein
VTAQFDFGAFGFSTIRNGRCEAELDDAVALGVVDPAREHRCATGLLRRAPQQRPQVVAIEDVVAEDQRRRLAGQKLAADQERLGDPAGAVLDRVGQFDPPFPAVAEQPLDFSGAASNAARTGMEKSKLIIIFQ